MVQITVSDDTIFQDSKPKEHAVTNCGNHTRYLVMVQGSLFLAVLMARYASIELGFQEALWGPLVSSAGIRR